MSRLLRLRVCDMFPRWIRGRVPLLSLLIGMVIASMWMRAGYPAFGVWAPHDDALFVELARNLNHFKWLGSYGQLTLAKGAFFPVFLAVIDIAYLPLKLTEHFLYLLASLLLAWTIGRASGSRLLFIVVFGVLAFSPLPWMFEGGSRVTREPLYQILTLLLLALAAMLLLGIEERNSIGKALGIVGACFWLTREEGVWLLPALAVLAIPFCVRVAASVAARDRARLTNLAKVLAVPLLTFLALVVVVNSLNWSKYGVFRNNDFRSGPFAEAYGALARIQPNQWQRYVVFPSDARQLAYSVSSAARELAPYLEGPQGKEWTKSSHGYPDPWGCVGHPENCSTEILSAWFVWALRGAVAAAGYYHSANSADDFYTRLAQEINQACSQERIPCAARRDSLIPYWRHHYLMDTVAASRNVMHTLMSLNQGHVGVPPSEMTDSQKRKFIMTINQDLSGQIDRAGKLELLRQSLTKHIAKAYALLSAPLFWCATAIHFGLLLLSVSVKSEKVPAGAIFLLSALFAAIVTRVVLLGFLEATSIPSNNLLYLIPVVPLYLSYVAMSVALGILVLARMVRSQADNAP